MRRNPVVAVAPPARATETNVPGTPLLYLHSAEVLPYYTLQRYSPCCTSTLQRYYPPICFVHCRGTSCTTFTLLPLCKDTTTIAVFTGIMQPRSKQPGNKDTPLPYLHHLQNFYPLFCSVLHCTDTPLVFHKLQR